MRKTFAIGMLFLFAVVSSASAVNIIHMVPDGMSIEALTAARLVSCGTEAVRDGSARLNMDRMPEFGYMACHSLSGWITGSAAAMTAMVTGQKTWLGMISQDSTGRRGVRHGKPLETILEIAEKMGMASGIVVTSRVTHATPASCYAHWYERNEENILAEQLVDAGVEVILGGGRRHFIPGGAKDEEGEDSKREDDRDLIEEMEAKGYTYLWNRKGFEAVHVGSSGKVLGLFENGHMEYELDRAGDTGGEPSLAEMTATAIQILSRHEKGFYLMVEGSRIDHAAHANDTMRWIYDTIAFDQAVGVAIDFAEQDGHTLVIVTPDHVTGGPAINGYWETPDAWKGAYEIWPDYRDRDGDGYPDNTPRYPVAVGWTSGGHTAEDVPVMAMGPGSAYFRGFLDNTEVFRAMKAVLSGTMEREEKR